MLHAKYGNEWARLEFGGVDVHSGGKISQSRRMEVVYSSQIDFLICW